MGAGGYGRVAVDVLIAAGWEEWIIGFYDDAHAVLSDTVRGFPILGDIEMLNSMLSVEPVQVIVAITDNRDRLRIANSIRKLGGEFLSAVHPAAYLSDAAVVGGGSVLAAGVVVHPDSEVGSHCYLGPQSVVDRDAVVGAGSWISAGAIVGSGVRIGTRVVLGQNSSVGRKAVVGSEVEIEAMGFVPPEGEV